MWPGLLQSALPVSSRCGAAWTRNHQGGPGPQRVHDQAANDGRRLAELRHTLFGAPAPETTPLEDRVTFAALRAAMPFDAIVFRAFWRVMGMLARPDDVYTDPDVVARTRDVLRSLDTATAMTQPTRAELEAALT